MRGGFTEIVICRGDPISIVGSTGPRKTALINDIEVLAQQNTVIGSTVLVNGALLPHLLVRDPAKKSIALITHYAKYTADLLIYESAGLDNSLNALMSLTMIYRLLLPVIASWRGVYREAIAAQIPFTRPLPAVLDALGIPYHLIREADELDLVSQIIEGTFADHTL